MDARRLRIGGVSQNNSKDVGHGMVVDGAIQSQSHNNSNSNSSSKDVGHVLAVDHAGQLNLEVWLRPLDGGLEIQLVSVVAGGREVARE